MLQLFLVKNVSDARSTSNALPQGFSVPDRPQGFSVQPLGLTRPVHPIAQLLSGTSMSQLFLEKTFLTRGRPPAARLARDDFLA
jgi:hypothetical protein